MLKIIISLFLIVTQFIAVQPSSGQELPGQVSYTTAFKQFVPAIITLSDGKIIKQNKANIFLKNSSLLYKHGQLDMEADIDQIKEVKFPDCLYVKIDTVLAKVIDTINTKRLLCVSLIDINAYRNQILNSQQITNFELGEHVNVTSTDVSPNEPKLYPVNNIFYFEISGKFIKVHERNVKRLLSSKNRRQYKLLIQSANFSWNSPQSLMKILELL